MVTKGRIPVKWMSPLDGLDLRSETPGVPSWGHKQVVRFLLVGERRPPNLVYEVIVWFVQFYVVEFDQRLHEKDK